MIEHPSGYGRVPASHRAPLPSEQVIVSAPMSFAGSARRILRAFHPLTALAGWRGVAWSALLVLTLILAWAGVLVWYCIFGLWLVPYRIIRRVQRNGKRKELRHREMLAAIDYQRKMLP